MNQKFYYWVALLLIKIMEASSRPCRQITLSLYGKLAISEEEYAGGNKSKIKENPTEALRYIEEKKIEKTYYTRYVDHYKTI